MSNQPTRPTAQTASNEQLIEAGYRAIDNILRKHGVDPQQVTMEDGTRVFPIGSVISQISIEPVGETPHLTVMAQVMTLPADRDYLVPLMRHLLELNLSLADFDPALVTANIGIYKDKVYIVSRRSMRDIDLGKIEAVILSTTQAADGFDDHLEAIYFKTSQQRTPPDDIIRRLQRGN